MTVQTKQTYYPDARFSVTENLFFIPQSAQYLTEGFYS